MITASGIELAEFLIVILSPQIVSAEGDADVTYLMQDKRVLADLPAMLEAAAEDLTDLLPPGYTARIELAESLGTN